ncbi:MAG TPA: branched-chain amino acid ABC transporter permease [Jatrophihabitans sp.]|nr:branched-chain amino acid ABC transporter permease [Jatrophihabitans sp.]
MTDQTGSGRGGVNAPVSASAAANPAQVPPAISEQRSTERPRSDLGAGGKSEQYRTLVKRLLGCLAAGFVLALMVGNQEGTQEDYGLAFRQAIFAPRIILFLLIGVLLFLVITFWPLVKPYLVRTGVRPLAVGALTVIVAQTVLHWYDPLGNGKFNTLAAQAANTNGLSPVAKLYFTSPVAWIYLIVTVGCAAVAIVRRIRVLAWAGAVLGLIGAIWAYTSHAAVVSFTNAVDHSLGAWVAALGYLTIAAASATIALARTEVAESRAFVDRTLSWRPGFPLAVVGGLVGLLAFGQATWFSPSDRNATLSDTHDLFRHTGLAPLALQYLTWLGYLLFLAALATALAGSYLRNAALGWLAGAVGAFAIVLTLVTMYDFTKLAAQQNFDFASGPWQNLGSGGWLACLAFFLTAGGGVLAALSAGRSRREFVSSDVIGGRRWQNASRSTRNLLVLGLGLALFYPPTATEFWQKVIVSEVGVYVLLAIGLNVVVGWAGLLDLGFIAFYAIGSYVTAYLVGSLPHKPPSWLQMSPLWAIPFAIGVCLLAGLALGAPTLRLRGDYLAIVTLGFGEIIRIAAINNPGNITNSTRGPQPAVPHPVLHIGPLKWVWGLNNLQYWYLLLFLIIVVVVAFYRLEGSRLGRAWAAIREDEVAAQASGINTTKVKLLAFAIGASTSGLAGVFFASQIGYFNPDNFVLNNSILVVAYVVFGGMGSLPGAMAGAAVLTWLPEFLKDQVPGADRPMWIGAAVLLMMIFRPAGLIPARRRQAELTGLDAPASAETRAVPASEGM